LVRVIFFFFWNIGWESE